MTDALTYTGNSVSSAGHGTSDIIAETSTATSAPASAYPSRASTSPVPAPVRSFVVKSSRIAPTPSTIRATPAVSGLRGIPRMACSMRSSLYTIRMPSDFNFTFIRPLNWDKRLFPRGFPYPPSDEGRGFDCTLAIAFTTRIRWDPSNARRSSRASGRNDSSHITPAPRLRWRQHPQARCPARRTPLPQGRILHPDSPSTAPSLRP